MALLLDRQERLWVGTGSGLMSFDRLNGRYTRWPGRGDDATGLGRAEIWDIAEGESGTLWIAATDSGLHHLDPDSGRDTRYRHDARDPASISPGRVLRLATDDQRRLYVAVENAGLNVLDLATNRFAHHQFDPEDEHSLNSGSIWALRFDDQGILWIGTFSGGVNSISPLGQRFQHVKARRGGLSDSARQRRDGGSSRQPLDRHGRRGLEPAGPQDGDLHLLPARPRGLTTIGSNAVWALLEDSQGSMWVGGWDGGLGRLDPTSGRVTRFRHDPTDPKSIATDHVWRILELSTGELLVVTHAGADFFDRKTRVFTRLAERYPGAGDDGVLYSAAEDREGNLWLVGQRRRLHIDRRTGRVNGYLNDPQDPRAWARPTGPQAVLVDSAGNVWLGTDGGLTCCRRARPRS